MPASIGSPAEIEDELGNLEGALQPMEEGQVPPFAAEQGPKVPPACLATMPDEVLLMIFSDIAASEQILQRRGRDGVNTLCDLALVCRRFRPIAQEALMDSIALDAGEIGYSESRLVRLLQFLFDNSWYRGRVRNLRVEARMERDFLPWRSYHDQDPEYDHLLQRCIDLAWKTKGNPAPIRQSWEAALCDGFEPAFVGVLIALLPNLENLVVLPSASETSAAPSMMELFGRDYETLNSYFPEELTANRPFVIPALPKLKQATFGSDIPPLSLDTLPRLREISLTLGHGHRFELPESYLHIAVLRISCAVQWIRAPHRNGRDDDIFWNIRMVLRSLQNLKAFHLYDETALTKNIDHLPPDEVCFCDRPFFFDYILEALYTACEHIETISLPGNWYRKNKSSRALIQRMPAFEHLKSMTAPDCALKGIGSAFDREFLSAPEIVGTTLQSLRILDPSVGEGDINIKNLFDWLKQLLEENYDKESSKKLLAALREICVVVGVKEKAALEALGPDTLAKATPPPGVCIKIECTDGTISISPVADGSDISQ